MAFPTKPQLHPDADARETPGSWSRQEAGEPALPPIGHVLGGKYRIDGILGRGGMGVVVAGHQLALDRRVAIKFLRRPVTEGARVTQRFEREALIIAKMQNEHIVRVFDVGEENGLPFIVMEHLEGTDLAHELLHGALSPAIAVSYLLEACEAIAEAHALGIVHRDIKPQNLFIAKIKGRRVLKVLDFGISKWLAVAPGRDTSIVTGDGGFVGTPAYMAPEQLTNARAVDACTDVWALGVVLYECLSGKHPFDAEGGPQLCAAILEAEPAPLDASRITAPLRKIVERCLKKAPAARFQSVVELARALAALGPPLVRQPPEWLESIAGPAAAAAPPRRALGPRLIVAGSALTLIAVALGLGRGSRPSASSSTSNPSLATSGSPSKAPSAASSAAIPVVPRSAPTSAEIAPAAAPPTAARRVVNDGTLRRRQQPAPAVSAAAGAPAVATPPSATPPSAAPSAASSAQVEGLRLYRR